MHMELLTLAACHPDGEEEGQKAEVHASELVWQVAGGRLRVEERWCR